MFKTSLNHINRLGNYYTYALGKTLALPYLIQSAVSSLKNHIKQYSIHGVLTIPLTELLEYLKSHSALEK